MKRVVLLLLFVVIGVTAPVQRLDAQDPITLIIKEGITNVIKAVDLKIQRLQNETIWLQNAQKVAENTLSKLKLDEITDWVQRQRELYARYFEELKQVKTVLTHFHRIREIIEQQTAIIKEYKRVYAGVKQDQHFTPDEVEYIGRVYKGIMEESIRNLDQLMLVIHSFTTQMSDGKRLELINTVAINMQQNFDDLKSFNEQNIQLAMQRAQDAKNITVVKKLYGIQ